MASVPRDHLFISYASENATFTDWLALRLACEGYKVWYDRLKLLGGESYPRDIDKAIAEETFRFIAVVSRASLQKPNPLKERTQALNISRARGVDFLIPLKLDPVEPIELGWQLSDLTYISFESSWSGGLAALLKRLQSLGTPRDQAWGRAQVAKWLVTKEFIKDESERIWSNLFPLKSIPEKIQLFKVRSKEALNETERVWPIAPRDDTSYWAFSSPEEGLGAEGWPTSHVVEWRTKKEALGYPTRSIVSVLIRRTIQLASIRRGLRAHPEKQEVYFPSGMFPSDRLYFVSYDGKKTFVQVSGERTRKGSDGITEVSHYSLSFGVRPVLFEFGEPVVRLSVGAHFTDVTGKDLSPARAGRKRKALGKSWWNYEWLARVLACGSWLADGKVFITLVRSPSGDLILAGSPLVTTSPIKIDEEGLGPQGSEEESEDEDEEEGVDDSSESEI
jgi:hypothetical protein